MCVYFVAMLCVGRFGFGWVHDAFIFACHMFMYFHAYVPSSFYIFYIVSSWCFSNFLSFSLSLSLSLSLSFTLVTSWHLHVNPLCPGTLFVPRHLLLLLLLTHSLSRTVPWWEGQIGLLEELFTTWHSFGTPSRSVKFLWHWPTHCHPQLGWESLCGVPVMCPSMII